MSVFQIQPNGGPSPSNGVFTGHLVPRLVILAAPAPSLLAQIGLVIGDEVADITPTVAILVPKDAVGNSLGKTMQIDMSDSANALQ
ncbi:hypothetical protein M407DRAFT_24767 [Tulasnella calospora MUT 4182]|uniref:Uncharacterized protein n=1 Tax=Tulasnella calospora MUT 4182 TaxID=1051891 RepID=A0A0C3KWV7_9AGAM|nr:hypothetical protein M407DRAFT_24767 [Tulasnella calospora MUT 4182]